MNKHSFYLVPGKVSFQIATSEGPLNRKGFVAIVPALPDFEFFYHREGAHHTLTEGRSGRIVKSHYSAAGLLEDVAELLQSAGPDMIAAQLQVAPALVA